jgi:peptidoglycan/LPS O-acetylase OafA/YrhL
LTNDFVYLIVAALWVATLRVYKENSKKTFIVGIVFIALCPLFLVLKLEPIAEQFVAWAFMFLVAGVIQLLFEMRSQKFQPQD